MVDLFRHPPIHIKEYQLVPTHNLAQDRYLPSPAVTQTACGPSLSSYTVLSFYLSEELAGIVVKLESFMQISPGEFLTRISNNPSKIFWPVVSYLNVYMKYFRW
jgi:hypothetical protein